MYVASQFIMHIDKMVATIHCHTLFHDCSFKAGAFLALMDTIVSHVKAGMSKRSTFARSGKSDRVF